MISDSRRTLEEVMTPGGKKEYRAYHRYHSGNCETEVCYEFDSEKDAILFILEDAQEDCQMSIPDWSWIGGMVYRPNRYYHGRYDCGFYGYRGREIKTWVRENFGPEDDMIYANSDDDEDMENQYDTMLNGEQLTAVLLKFG